MLTRTRLSVMIVAASAGAVAGAAAVAGFPAPPAARGTVIAGPSGTGAATTPAVAQAPAGNALAVTPTAIATAAATTPAPRALVATASARATPVPSLTAWATLPGKRRIDTQAPRDNLASRLTTLPAATSQVIIVHAEGYSATNATVEAFERDAAGWRPVSGKVAARIGARGFRDDKVEGDLATPTGMYPIGATMYGVAPNPGVRYPYHQLVEHDYWNGNSDSPQYNSFVHGSDPGGASEALWRITPQYNHFAVIDYNVPAVPRRGSAIFLHVMVPGRATAGCVSMAELDLRRMLRWLNPAAAPRIVLAPDQALSRY